MPFPFILHVYNYGLPEWFPDPWKLAGVTGALGALAITKRYFNGALNLTERNMHGRVVIMTGGTSGVGAAAALELAKRGAQLCLLTQVPASDPFLVEYIDDLRARTNNQLIYAEQVDLADLHSVRQFATKWIDNAPPRRLDMVICCAATLTPPGGARQETPEGIELTWMVNYLANYHLLAILSPAIKAQPFDRDVRVILTTCSSYIRSPPLRDAQAHALDKKGWSPAAAYASSKLALMTFGQAFQKHLDTYKRPDGLPMNAKVVFVDPGFARTPGMRRWVTRGSIWGLFIYLISYFLTWVFLKSPFMAAQSILFGAFDGSVIRDPGGKIFKECIEVDCARKDVKDEEVAKKLWESSDKLVETVEKQAAQKRAQEKKVREEKEKREKAEQESRQRAEEIEALVETIKKGKAKEKEKENEADKKTKYRKAKFGHKAVQ
jgi:NAD(P)-dependent dehydrogenase (short-subunit alcohol dehydrogenase family)